MDYLFIAITRCLHIEYTWYAYNMYMAHKLAKWPENHMVLAKLRQVVITFIPLDVHIVAPQLRIINPSLLSLDKPTKPRNTNYTYFFGGPIKFQHAF